MAPSLIEQSYSTITLPSVKQFVPNTSEVALNTQDTDSYLDEKHSYERSTDSFTIDDTSSYYSQSSVGDIDLQVDVPRLWHDIHYTAKWGAIEGTNGMGRLALSDADKYSRDWFVNEAKILGCKVKIDKMGNTFAILPGENMSLAPIAMGSHLDTQPAGGRFDGILGVLAGLEVLRTIKESGRKPYTPIAAIVWTNEEGARFNPGCTGSAVWSGRKPLSDAYRQRDDTGVTLESELHRINYAGGYHADHRINPLSAHLELHIEQGCHLENTGKGVGVVTGVQGNRWFKVQVNGVRAHAGSTPMHKRADAVVATAQIITSLREEATRCNGFATVGVVNIAKASSNTISGDVNFTIDIRHSTTEGLDAMEQRIRDEMKSLTTENPKLNFSMSLVWESPAVKFDETLLSCIRIAASHNLGPNGFDDMHSLAGHDSALTATVIPTAMIFVPSKDGISHSPEEFTSEKQCGIGAQVLLDSVCRYDDIIRKHITGV